MLYRLIGSWLKVINNVRCFRFSIVTSQSKVSEFDKSCTKLGTLLKALAKSEKEYLELQMGEVLKYLSSKFQQKTSCNRYVLSNILI